MTENSIINVNHLTMSYGDDIIAKDLSFSVDKGDIFMILGSSGSGKSTLMRYMLGLEPAEPGKILLFGRDINTPDLNERREILQKIGVTYQTGALFGSMTLLENVRLPLEEFTEMSDEAMDALARQKLLLAGLSGYEDYLPSEISGGMKKRAGIARAMALDPEILFLDEPSAGLDPLSSLELDELIVTLSELLDITFVIVSHELASIFNIAKHVILLDKESQSLIAEGDPKKLRTESHNEYVLRFLNRGRKT